MGEAFTLSAKAITHPPAQLASIVVQPYHVAHNLKLLFLKNNNGANDFLVKIYLHFTQKYYTVLTVQSTLFGLLHSSWVLTRLFY